MNDDDDDDDDDDKESANVEDDSVEDDKTEVEDKSPDEKIKTLIQSTVELLELMNEFRYCLRIGGTRGILRKRTD